MGVIKQPDLRAAASRQRPLPSRRSACATQVRQLELERLRQMSVESRIVMALTMSARFAWLRPHATTA